MPPDIFRNYRATQARRLWYVRGLLRQRLPGYELKDRDGLPLLVTRDPSKPGRWRVTWFCSEGPAGHCEAPTVKDALLAAFRYGATVP